ncbi:HK97 gp10 family phage protein [Clostridium chrysemydis]|uniref:HK97 gp10 family phage protein n=1 Tax=Clostridium chrysemydis TaxID=2665504 RepID=UPI003F2DB540
MGFDFKGLEKFSKDFKKTTNDFDKFLSRFLTDIGIEVLEKTKKRTPKVTGDLREGFEVTNVAIKGNEVVIYLKNDKDYASYIELGHKEIGGGWIEGAYMATISMEEVERNIPKKFQADFAKFMKRLGA